MYAVISVVSDTCWQTVTTSSQFPIRLPGRLELRARYKSEHVAIGNKHTDPRERLPTRHSKLYFHNNIYITNHNSDNTINHNIIITPPPPPPPPPLMHFTP